MSTAVEGNEIIDSTSYSALVILQFINSNNYICNQGKLNKVIGEKNVPLYAYKASERWSPKSPKLQLFQEIGHIKSSQCSQQLHTYPLSSEVNPKENSTFLRKLCVIYEYDKELFVAPWWLLRYQLFMTCSYFLFHLEEYLCSAAVFNKRLYHFSSLVSDLNRFPMHCVTD